MNMESLRLIRNILLRSAVVGSAIILVQAFGTYCAWDTWTGMARGLFHTDEAQLSTAVLAFFTVAKFYLSFIVLTPALAIHWTLKREESRTRSDSNPMLNTTKTVTQP